MPIILYDHFIILKLIIFCFIIKRLFKILGKTLLLLVFNYFGELAESKYE